MVAAMTVPERLIVGISGASGVIYGVRLLEALRPLPVESHLVMSPAAEKTLALETRLKVAQVRDLADVWYPVSDIAAAPSSGSFRTLGMIVAPCSMRTLAEIACGTTSNLLSRAADVVLKERRRLVLMARETPLNGVHLRNMLTLTELGAIVAPPVPAFYSQPKNVDDIVDHTVGRVLDLFNLETGKVRRWGEPRGAKRPRRSPKKP
jgi:flavin prenyltransferase